MERPGRTSSCDSAFCFIFEIDELRLHDGCHGAKPLGYVSSNQNFYYDFSGDYFIMFMCTTMEGTIACITLK